LEDILFNVTTVRIALALSIVLTTGCGSRRLAVQKKGTNTAVVNSTSDLYQYQPASLGLPTGTSSNYQTASATPVPTAIPTPTPVPPVTSCTLSTVSPAPGQPLPAGAIGKILLNLTSNVPVSSLTFRDETPGANLKIIDPPGSRQIMVRPTARTSYVAEWRTSYAQGNCRATIEVASSGQFYNGGSVVIVTGPFPSTPPSPEPIPTFDLQLQPICSVQRRLEPKQVYQSIVAKGARATISVEAVTASGQKEVLFGRHLPPESALLSGGFHQPIPIELMSYALNNNVEIRVCHDTNNNFKCSDEHADNIISTGRQAPGNSGYLNQSVYSIPAANIPNLVVMETWNRRGARQGAADPTCTKQYSPLVLDLKGDGILTSSAEDSGVLFDLTATGELVRSGWVRGTDDAFLVRDINKDGYIKDGSELFGSATKLRNGQLAENGFAALHDLDSNGDGKINASDTKFGELKIWLAHDFRSVRDSAKPTLHPLNAVPVNGETLRISEIDLAYVEVIELQNGNVTRQQSNFFILKSGLYIPRLIADIWFKVLPY